MGHEQRNLELIQTLDDAGNAQDWDCTVARWDEVGEIIEGSLFYDVVGLMRQVGIG